MSDRQQTLPPSNTMQPFVIGTDIWPGVAKSIEETSELGQALGKLMAYPDGPHPDGGNTHEYTMDEVADVQAALDFLIDHNSALDPNYIEERRRMKYDRFVEWHNG